MSDSKIKILILGIGQSNFLNQLYGGIQKETEKFQFSIDGYFDLSKGVTETSLPYKNFYNLKKKPISKYQGRRALLSFARQKLFYEVILFELSQKSSYKKIKQILFDLAITKYRIENFEGLENIDLYHFHFCSPQNLMMTYFLPKQARYICTFWGSDLMRKTGVSNVFYVEKALKRATQITVQTPEMAEMLYCKYGRGIMPKTKSLLFTIDERIFQEIDDLNNNEEEISQFKEDYGIPINKTVVAIGHNAFQENNHLKIINALEKLNPKVLKQCVFILHLSYGGNQAYIDELIQLGKSHKQLTFVVIQDFLGPKKIALLRISTDILVQMPISDALSGAMTEVLYAGNIVIAGSWLPYGFFRRSKLWYYEADDFSNLPSLLTAMVQEKERHRENNKDNRENIRQYFFPTNTTPQWIKLFDSTAKLTNLSK